MTTNPVELRPRSIGEIFGLTFDLYRRNFPLFIGIAAVVLIPILLVSALSELVPLLQVAATPAAFTNQAASADMFTFTSSFAWLTGASSCLSAIGLLLGIFWPWMEGALAFNVIERVLGRTPGLRASYGQTRPRWGALWGSNILAQLGIGLPIFIAYVLVFVGLIATGVLAAAFAGSTSSEDVQPGFLLCLTVLCVPAFIAALVISIALSIQWAFRVPVIAGEGAGGIQALSRSTAIARGDRWRIFGRYLLLFIIEFVVLVVPLLVVVSVLLIGVFGQRTPVRFDNAALPTLVAISVIAVAISFIGSLLLTPLRVIFTTVNYLDLRIRKENLAVALLKAAAPTPATLAVGVGTPTPVVAPSPGPVPMQPLTPVAATPELPTAAVMSASASGVDFTKVNLAELTPGERIGLLFNRIRSEGENPHLLSEMGMAYMDIGDLGGALDALTRARAIAPRDADVAFNLMLVYRERRDINNARQMMREYLRLETNPDDSARVRNDPRFKDLLPE